MIRGLSTFPFLIDEDTYMESEWIKNRFELLFETMLSASSIEQVSAGNIEASFGKHFLHILFLNIIPHPFP